MRIRENSTRWRIEPWDEPVSTSTLLRSLADAYEKYVILPPHGATAMALWNLHAWALEAAYVSPILMFVSPEPQLPQAAKAEAERAAEEKRKAENRKRSGPVPRSPSKELNSKVQRNFTDPDSRVLLTKDGFIQGYNAQAAVDGAKQIIVAHGLTQSMSDCPQLVPLVDAVRANLGRKPREISADAGYCSEGNLLALATRKIHAYVATGRAKHPAETTRKVGGEMTQKMRQKLKRAGYRSRYRFKASRGAGVRADQASTRISTIPAAWP